ncbi:pyruvate carboxylase [Blastopirellula marina]|uniref:Pyruvate carboxylase n=1 Tax=Blastopirellula marina TaxID=124 RepID=A0A2S8G0M9_9BACT|nr:pyruvate carboxylase [Blastopirellula marina]PQO37998.1 pyruvate carboxylase [Blastopirellula marina]PTL44654.1 pyruvate carboxylase [Blastopirellula marina]
MKKISKLLVTNRSEIAIRIFRSAHELGIRTVGMYSYEDRFALHRFKADEAYLIGQQGEPVRAYLDIPGVIRLCKEHNIDAIHPGYGFMSENPDLADACDKNGIVFVGPSKQCLEMLGDKTAARSVAKQAGVSILGGSDAAIEDVQAGRQLAEKMGFPIILKAAKGGGGRGMRVVRTTEEFEAAFKEAQRESLNAFGSPDIFIEKFIQQARHIEVQLLGDRQGNLVHLFERDCSVQRRHQKVVEIAPAPSLDPKIRQGLCDAAVAIGKAVGYYAAGTVEFLVDAETGQYYFIEVNPRIQVEHTVTEEITGIDLVKAQILVAQGDSLDHPEIGIPTQESVVPFGFALQCRVTTEDPTNKFLPDYGRVSHYRSGAGMGVRLDAGSAFSGAVVHPYYDSLLVKVTARGRRFVDAARRMDRVLQEFRVRGVKTNIPFLIRLMKHPKFIEGTCTTRFIDETPELLEFTPRRDRATKLLKFLGDVAVNGNPLVKDRAISKRRDPAPTPALDADQANPPGSRDRFKQLGVEKFAQWVREQKQLLFTDTTFRDAHQSLLATRVRTKDLLNISEAYARNCPEMFSLEMWGGATFDTTMRFLKESPWQRLADMRERVPNILFQMLLRASNAVGYTNYPDNVVVAFVEEAAQAGMDIFRVFDALNWVPNMKVAMEAVIAAGGICEASICYTGDISNPKRDKYNLQYYVDLAKQLESMGAHFLAIKDMAGLCKPTAARKLIKTLREEIGLPIHFHTHDTAGIQAASILEGAEVGLDIADAAMAPLSGGTSQPNLNTVVEMLRGTPQESDLKTHAIDEIAEYWRSVREFYTPFESTVLPATADLYRHEMPGGQYTNLFQQAHALGLSDQWAQICEIYAQVNDMLGDIVKVTPTSKAVGDMALFMVANDLTPADVLNPERELAFPASVKDLLGGRMGQPPGGFPEALQKRVMRDEPILTTRPGESFEPADFAAAEAKVEKFLGHKPKRNEVVSYLLYPKVYEDFAKHQVSYGDVSGLPTPVFFYGQEPGEELAVDIETGKTLIVKFLTISDPHPDGSRVVFFELNGQPREVSIIDQSLESDVPKRQKADADDPKQIGSSMPGMVVTIAVEPGEKVAKGQKLLSLEAMKMETTVYAEVEGTVEQVLVKPGSQVETGDLMIKLT